MNTNGRDWLLACLEAIERTHPPGVSYEVLVLDNASEDGSAEAVREAHPAARLIALERRTGKAENDRTLLQRGARRATACCSTRTPSCARAPRGRCSTRSTATRARGRRRAAADQRRCPTACAWRLPNAGRALAGRCSARSYAVQSRGEPCADVGWVQSSAMLVRRAAAEEVGWLDPDFFVYSDETDFCKRLHDAGWRVLFVPQAARCTTTSCPPTPTAMRRRIVEFHRGRDLYFRKHRMPVARVAVARLLDVGLPGRARSPRRCCRATARAATWPTRVSSWNPATARGCASWPRSTTAARCRRALSAAPWRTLTPPNWPRSAARSDRCWRCSRAAAVLLAGLVLLAAAEAGLALSLGDASLSKLSSAAGAAAAVAGLLLVGGRRGACSSGGRRSVPIVVLVAAPFRPPIDFVRLEPLPGLGRQDGRLGRLLPLYFVLAAAGGGARLARAARPAGARAAAGDRPARPRRSSRSRSCRCCGPTTSRPARTCSCSSRCRSRRCWRWSPRADFPDWVPRALGVTALALGDAVRAGRALSRRSPTSCSSTRPTSPTSNANTDYFRVTSLFGDPSLYGRHVVLGIGVGARRCSSRGRWRTLAADRADRW